MLGPSLVHVWFALVTNRVGELRAVGSAARCSASASWSTFKRRVRWDPDGFACWPTHVLPAAWPAVTVQATLGMAAVMLAEASLSFLGLGVQPPTPSWGAMLDAGRSHLLDAPHLSIVPGAAIALVIISLNLVATRSGDPVTIG